MQFRVQCSLDNPLNGFKSASATSGSVTHETTVPKPHVSVTCLLTGAPPLGVHKHSQSLHRGLNFVSVCVTHPDVAKLAFAFGEYLSTLPNAKAYAF